MTFFGLVFNAAFSLCSTASTCARLAALCGLLVWPARAQGVRARTLGPGTLLPGEFTALTSVRELSDGRVLVSDEKENRLFLIDSARGTPTAIGRLGDGPGEYRRVGRLWALGGDSTFMMDPQTQIGVVLAGAKIVRTRPRIGGLVESGLIHGMDRAGNRVRVVHSLNARGKLSGLKDSMFVLRVRSRGRVDTLSRVPSEYVNVDPAAVAARLVATGVAVKPRVYRAAIVEMDQVIMSADGWVAIARTHPYRVDWCPPGLGCLQGAPIEPGGAPMTEADKRSYIAERALTSEWPDTLAPPAVVGWPEVLPPFAAKVSRIDASPLIVAPDGTLLIERTPSARSGASRWYDIVDRRGSRTGRLEVPLNSVVVGVGARSIYLAVFDADNVQTVHRHPWPQ